MAGYKGFGLGLAAEILGGILTGYGASYAPDFAEGNGCFITVLNVAHFIPIGEFCKKVDALLKYIKAVPTDRRTEEILIPGEPEYHTREKRLREGIPVEEAVWEQIKRCAARLGVGMEACETGAQTGREVDA